MKILKCKICRGEVNIIGNDKLVIKKTKCQKCGHSNNEKQPEIVIFKKRSSQ